MIYQQEIANEITILLLKIEAIKLSPKQPYTWASGLKSPIYCDNRITLSSVYIRKQIAKHFATLINDKFPETELIAGVATGAIAHGMLVADLLNLPFAYVRSSPKGHGLENMVEGKIEKGQNIVVVEDLISTGMSSLKAVKALRDMQTNVIGMAAIFSYDFDTAFQNFNSNQCLLYTLSNYESLINEALKINYIEQADLILLDEWRKHPEHWK